MLTSVARALLAVILLASWSPSSATAAGEGSAAGADAGGDEAGFVIVQIDGLSEPVLRLALESGAMPFVQGLVEGGSHTIGSWRTTAASTTTVTQAGLLHGKWRDIPAFRWWDRETGQLLDFLDREQARVFADSLEGPNDLLSDGGASITNLYSGGAPRVILTATRFDGAALAWELVRYMADLPKDLHVAAGLADGALAGLMRVVRGESAPLALGLVGRKAPVPVVGPALEWALVDVTAAALRARAPARNAADLSPRSPRTTRLATMPARPTRRPSMPSDTSTMHCARSALQPRLPIVRYRLVILSDHGQTDGQPFAVRHGETLDQVVRGLLSDPGR